MKQTTRSYQSSILRGMVIVAIINLVATILILGFVRVALLDSLTGEYLKRLGDYIEKDIRFVLLIGDPYTTQTYVDDIIELPWMASMQLTDDIDSIAKTGDEISWVSPINLYTEEGEVRTVDNQTHFMKEINVSDNEARQGKAVRMHITMYSDDLSNVIDRMIIALLASVVTLSVGLCVVATRVSKNTTRVVGRISDQMSLINLEHGVISEVEVKSNIKEFITVRDSYNLLVRRVEEHNSSLEQQIDGRTRELVDALEENKKVAAYRSSLIMNLSHDLRTPLTANLGYLDIAHEEMDSFKPDLELVAHAINGARSRGLLLAEEMDTLLQISVSADDMPHLDIKSINLEGLLAETLNGAMQSGIGSGNTLKFEFIGERNFSTAERLVRHVVDNLLSNANRYCKNGTVEVKCEVGESMELTVADTGPGVPENERESIFEPHFRSSVNKSIGPKGMGIGLSMSKMWVDHLGGSIALIPDKERTIFHVSIPESVES
ncbi:HAMP domain-containing histidine kinase [bacterium]|nr:HAMP domain-containing histidine kinase [bacterium]